MRSDELRIDRRCFATELPLEGLISRWKGPLVENSDNCFRARLSGSENRAVKQHGAGCEAARLKVQTQALALELNPVRMR